MAKTYESVEGLVKDLSDDKEFAKGVLQEINDKSLSKLLFSLRCSQGLTQKQLADKMKCTQSRISKIEHSYNKDLTVKDLLEYADALNFQLNIGYREKNLRLTDLIKHHAFKLKQHLDTLAGLGGKDKQLLSAILGFFKEVHYNINNYILDSASKLEIPKTQEERIHVSLPEEYMAGDTDDKSKQKRLEHA
ncbi:MAG: helix-turn-helix domain-containing protein [Candidatus Anammoxibacter sp.]